MRLLLVTSAVSFVACICLTPLVKVLARRLGIIDYPDQHRKLHKQPTPLGGGVAVFLSFLFAVLVVLTFSDSQRASAAENLRFIVGLGVSAFVICVVGLLDDRFKLRGRQKLFGQILAAGIMIAFGPAIRNVQVFGFTVELGLLAVPFTLCWLLAAVNALNLIDGLDGLATSVGVVLSAAISVMAMLTGHPTEAFLAMAMAGALAGFLFYNTPPASIFLGDAGSMLIGLVLGALAIRGALKGPATIVLAAPTAIWAIPIFDVGMAILRRSLTGQSVYTADRGHLHHSLQQKGIGNRSAVLFIGALCSITALGATLSVSMHNEWLAYGSVLAVCAVLVVTRVFGHQECLLLCQRTKGLLLSLVPTLPSRRVPRRQMQTRLRGDRQWEELWQTLTEFAETFDLHSIQLNVNLPAIGEEYHASWDRRGRPPDSELWHSDIPLVAGNVTVGRLKITGACTEGSVCYWMGDLITGLKPFEAHLIQLLEDSASPVVGYNQEAVSTTLLHEAVDP